MKNNKMRKIENISIILMILLGGFLVGGRTGIGIVMIISGVMIGLWRVV